MSTLQLSLGQGGQYILDAVPEFTDLALCLHSTLSFHAVKRLHDGKSSVYEGKLEMGPCVPIDVVCKIVFGSDPDKLDDLNDEATFYTTKLKALQGSTVPKFYGLFAGMYTNALGRKRRMTCILLESWGAPLKRMNDCPMKLRVAIMEALLRVHAAGIQHNDLRQSNILISADSSEVRLIDFDEATEHQCRRRKQITLYTYPPTEAQVMCEEVYETAWVMTIWTPNWVRFYGLRYPIDYCPTPAKLMEVAEKDMEGSQISQEKIRKVAEKVIDGYYKAFGGRFRSIGKPGEPKPATETTDSDPEPGVEGSAVQDTRVHTLGRL